jgi:hypothetical protein
MAPILSGSEAMPLDKGIDLIVMAFARLASDQIAQDSTRLANARGFK